MLKCLHVHDDLIWDVMAALPTASLDKPCHVGCNAMVVARSEPTMLTVGCRNAGETVDRTLVAFWIELLNVYKPVATTSVTAASHLTPRYFLVQVLYCLAPGRGVAWNDLPVQLGVDPLLQVS